MAQEFLNEFEKNVGVPCNFDSFEAIKVFPGDNISETVSQFGKKLKLGDGLAQIASGKVIATLAGTLQFQPPNIYWVDHYDHRYIPKLEDNVIGVVSEVFGDHYRVELESHSSGSLDVLAFDGATKRYKPNFQVGTLVYCRISQVHKDMDPQLSCMVKTGPKKDWMTGQAIYGELKKGFTFKTSLSLTKKLLNPKCPVLVALGKSIAFEIAIGVNGIVWVNAMESIELALIVNAIRKSEKTDEAQIPAMVTALIKSAMKSA